MRKSDLTTGGFSGILEGRFIKKIQLFRRGPDRMMRKTFNILLMLPIVLYGCVKQETPGKSKEEEVTKMAIRVTSPAFEEGGMIPSKYTADGLNVSPPLEWAGVPDGTKSIALISDDPDAPVGTWVHWVMWNIPPEISGLPENVPPDRSLSDGSKQGITDFRSPGYGGPAPPSGTHRYYFKIYALDMKLDLPDSSTKADLLKAMKGRILAEGQLMGKYKRR
jgi:Raf kinase inhibitor-like YbhB/YbcL family protein